MKRVKGSTCKAIIALSMDGRFFIGKISCFFPVCPAEIRTFKTSILMYGTLCHAPAFPLFY